MMGRRNKFRRGAMAIPLLFGLGGMGLGGWIGGMVGMATVGSLVGFALGSLLGSAITGGGSMSGSVDFAPIATATVPRVGNYPIQQSSKGGAVPVIFGTRKVAGNIVWMSDATVYTEEI